MLGWFGKKKKKAQTDEEILAAAFVDVKRDQEKKEHIRKRLYRRLWPAWLDRRIVIGMLAIAVAIIADGVRRENAEFYATITKTSGTVWVHPREGASGNPAAVGTQLKDRNMVSTAAYGGAVLDFPDGSVITVGPNSQFVVKLLEYSRGGRWRERSFYLRVGQMWARVSPYFGAQSEMRIYTPSSVAAVRGTTFCVVQDPQGTNSEIHCADGYVAAVGFRGRPQYVYANSGATVKLGQAAPQPRLLTRAQQQPFTHEDLLKPIPPEHWLKTFEPELPIWFLGTVKIPHPTQEFLSGSGTHLQNVSLEPS